MEKRLKVRLVSYQQPSEEFVNEDIKDALELVAFCARVSNPSNQYNNQTAAKLIKYLIKHSHWSPLEMVNVCLEIETTRDIARQILRHRSFSFQEFSQRYADPSELGFVTREARLQDDKNRQNSIDLDFANDIVARDISMEWRQKQLDVITVAREAYDWAIFHGLAKECARVVLPEGNTVSKMYMNGTLRSWIHYGQVREGNGTQKEHALIALECAKVISTIFPLK